MTSGPIVLVAVLCGCAPSVPCKHLIRHGHQINIREHPGALIEGVHDTKYLGDLGPLAVIVKTWRIPPSSADDFIQDFVERLSAELDKWCRLDHPQIGTFHGAILDLGVLPSLILPYAENGTIVEYVRNNPSVNVTSLLRDAADGLNYLHNLNPAIIHGDINGSTIAVNRDGRAYIYEIGTTTISYRNGWTTPNLESSIRWTAPEILNPANDAELSPTTSKSDVWSFGMTALEVYTGNVPYSHRHRADTAAYDIMRGIEPGRPQTMKLTDEMWGLLTSCWEVDPVQRPDMTLLWNMIQLFSLHEESSTWITK